MRNAARQLSNNFGGADRDMPVGWTAQTGDELVPTRQKKGDDKPHSTIGPALLRTLDLFAAADGGQKDGGLAAPIASVDPLKEEKPKKRPSVYSGTRADGGLPATDSLSP